MIAVFTDIDGVLNTVNELWKPSCIELYDKVCEKYNLLPVISSTWRTNHTIEELNRIFEYNGIFTKIYDYTPILGTDRGLEIEQWLKDNDVSDYIILDDQINDIVKYGLKNVIKCRSWLGFTEDEFNEIEKIFTQKHLLK